MLERSNAMIVLKVFSPVQETKTFTDAYDAHEYLGNIQIPFGESLQYAMLDDDMPEDDMLVDSTPEVHYYRESLGL
jgi:hypothetical protein